MQKSIEEMHVSQYLPAATATSGTELKTETMRLPPFDLMTETGPISETCVVSDIVTIDKFGEFNNLECHMPP
jgi:hypothetical protein